MTFRLIRARPEAAYGAFLDPLALALWLPPGRMTGRMRRFDPGVGGGYEMSLYYPEDEPEAPGKAGPLEDRVHVRFEVLDPPRCIVETVWFDGPDPALRGEMTMTIGFAAAADGVMVSLACENLPPGIRPEDNDLGARQSLSQLAAFLER